MACFFISSCPRSKFILANSKTVCFCTTCDCASVSDCLAFSTLDCAALSWASYSGDDTRPSASPSVTLLPSSTFMSVSRPGYFADTSTWVASRRPLVFTTPFGIFAPVRRLRRLRTRDWAWAAGANATVHRPPCTSGESENPPPAIGKAARAMISQRERICDAPSRRDPNPTGAIRPLLDLDHPRRDYSILKNRWSAGH